MDTIKRADLIRAVKILGYEASDVEYMTISPNEVRVTLFERGEHGMKILNGNGTPLRRVEVSNVSA